MTSEQPFLERTPASAGSPSQPGGILVVWWRRLFSTGALAILAALLSAVATLPSTGATFNATTNNAANLWSADSLESPTLLTVTGGGNATLDWTAAGDTYATGHRIYRAASSGAQYTQIAE